MSHGHSVDIHKHIRIYITVFIALAVLTVVTVAISYLHLITPLAVGIALLVATIKASLVACYFMHLISEKKTIFLILLVTGVFFIGMIVIILLTTKGMMFTHVS